MSLKRLTMICVIGLLAVAMCQVAFADEDAVHMFSGVVKHIDHGSKTMVVKAADGTEHSVKWTGKTSWEGTKESGKGIKEGSEVSVKYTEKAGEKTAVGVKDAGKAVGKAAAN